MALLDQIKASYGKVDKFIETTVVNNNTLDSYDASSNKELFRKLDKIWVLPITENNDNFNLTVVVEFKINEGKKIKLNKNPLVVIQKKRPSQNLAKTSIKNNYVELKKISHPKKSTKHDKVVITNPEKESSNLVWWIAGGVAVVGGVAAALLLKKDDTTTSPSSNTSKIAVHIKLPE